MLTGLQIPYLFKNQMLSNRLGNYGIDPTGLSLPFLNFAAVV